MTSRRRRSIAAYSVLLASAVFGCATPLRFRLLAAGAKKPAQVAVLMELEHVGKQLPVEEKNVSVAEDGASLSPERTHLTLLDPHDVIAERTVVLVDASAAVVESGQIGDVAAAVARFAQRLEKSHRVAVAAWDGADGVVGILPFSAKAEAVDRRLDALLTLKPRGKTSNLNGAVVESLQALDRAQQADSRPVKIGRLVIVTGGRDDAKKVSKSELVEALRAHKDIAIVAIGFGELIDQDGVEAIGRDGAYYDKPLDRLVDNLDRIAGKVEREGARRLLVSYCSPKRQGQHAVEVSVKTDDGRRGIVQWKFDASDFKAGCDADRMPSFVELAEPTPRAR
jgi:von Willebrand factor type A domain